jgi:hypothetical protein
MKCDRYQDLFADEWDGTISETDKARLELHLGGCHTCREERESLKRLWARLGAVPSQEPGPALRPRFYAMLEGYQEGLGRSRTAGAGAGGIGAWFGSWFAFQPALQLGVAVLLLTAGFFAGYVIRPGADGREEMAGLREEVHEMRQMVTISLLKQQSASERLKGVSLTSQVASPDPEFLTTLIHTLNYDPNVDVRLAAVDALSRFAGDPAVRMGLVKSLPKQESPMVQISLIDLLVQLHERQSVDVLRQLVEDASQNQQVRQRAQWGLQKLS